MKWGEGVKAYIPPHSWVPTNLTDSQFTCVLDFAYSLPPLSARLQVVKANDQKSDVGELESHAKILIMALARKLQMRFKRRNADPESAGINEEDLCKHSVSSNLTPQ